MTYLFKLARRLAFAHPITWTILLVMACSEPAPREFLGPDPKTPSPAPTSPVSLVVSQPTEMLPYDQTLPFRAWGRTAAGDSVGVAVSWTATGGQILSDGTYRGTTPGTHTVRAYSVVNPALSGTALVSVSQPGPLFQTLSVAPKPVHVSGGARVLFAATARLQSGANTLPTVTWSATGGSISPQGEFAAGYEPGRFQVVATTLDGLLSDTAAVVIDPPLLTDLQLSPRVVTMPGSGTQEFTVSAAWSDGSTDLPEVEWQSAGGTIAPAGGSAAGGPQAAGGGSRWSFTADRQPGNYKVVVRNARSGKSDTSNVTITPVLDRIEVTPEATDLIPGATRAFTASGWLTDGNPTPVLVSWAATGGTISGSGVYSAGSTPGTFRVVGRSSDGRLADTAVVRIAQPAATLTRLTISPASGSVPVGGVTAFTAQALWSDGSTALPQLVWSAQAGSITSAGAWTAPAAAGSYRVIVRQSGGTVADTAQMEVVVPPPSLASLSVTPEAPAVLGGQVVEFAAQATWTDGSTTLPPLNWSATGGNITTGGRWTAPNVGGTYRVVARQSSGTLADTAVVGVTETPRVTAIRLEPGVAALNPQGTVQFSATATWSDGLTRTVPFTWTATGGSIGMEGLFTAGNLAGQFMVIATCVGCGVADTSAVTITQPVVPAPVVTQLQLDPPTLSLQAGESRTFAVTATWSDGSTTVPPLAWTAGGGTMQGMTYTAGATAGTFTVIARDAGGTRADTSQVTISVPAQAPPTLTGLVLTPGTVTLVPGEQRTFNVGATWSDGTTTLPPLAWSATGGTLNGLVYTAGTTAGSFRVIVSHQGGSRADTSTVTVQAPATLQSLVVTPASASVNAGTTFQFAVAGTWSDGGSAVPAVTWTATGGSISSTGLYTAGGTTGSFQVTATHAASGLTAQRAVSVTPASTSAPALPELPRVYLNTTYQAPTGRVISVAAGGNLQNAINSAACGDEIQLARGAVFTGAFVLPARSCATNPIHIRTAGTLPPEGVRVSPAVAASYGFARIQTADYQAALRAATGAFGYRLVAVEVTAATSATYNYGLLTIGAGDEGTLSAMPGHVVIDRVYVHGFAALHLKRCIALNGVSTAVVDSHLSECHAKGQDSQAIAGWNGPGPYKIVNNHLEGAAENVLFGGAGGGPAGPPSDIEIRRNYIYKPLSWLASGAYTVKNLLELKHAVRVLIEANVFQNNWADGQTGTAIVIMPINDGGTSARPTMVTDVTMRLNRVIASGNGISIIGRSGYAGSGPSEQLTRFAMENNTFEEIGRGDLRSDGRMMQIFVAARDITINHNTFLHSQAAGARANSAIYMDAAPDAHQPLAITNNLYSGGTYGLQGVGSSTGTNTLNTHARNWQFVGNALTGQGAYPYGAQYYPAGNYFPASVSALGLDANLRLGAGSGLVGRATDGKDVGADINAVLAATAGVVP